MTKLLFTFFSFQWNGIAYYIDAHVAHVCSFFSWRSFFAQNQWDGGGERLAKLFMDCQWNSNKFYELLIFLQNSYGLLKSFIRSTFKSSFNSCKLLWSNKLLETFFVKSQILISWEKCHVKSPAFCNSYYNFNGIIVSFS